jgi:hypothetical protein
MTRLAGEIGAAIGSYRRHFARALGHVQRPGFLTSWAESERWQGGDWTQRNSQRRAIQSGWYFAAISTLLDIIIQARFQIIDQDGDEPIAIEDHPLVRLIRRPNPWMGRAFLWEFSYWWFRLDGNFYWFVACDESSRTPLELWPIPAGDVIPFPGDKDRFIDYYEYTVYGRIYRIPVEYVVHVRRPNPFNIFDGLSDLVPGMLPIDSDLAMSRWNGQFFGRDNVMPSAVINLSSGDPSKPINPADVLALKDDLRSEYQAHKRKTAVTSAYKVDVNNLGWNPKDMDFIQGRGFTKEEIWAIARVHAGAFDPNSTEANANVGERRIRDTAWGDLTRIAEQLTVDLVIPFYGSQYEATFEDIRIADRQLELQEVDRARGALTVNEVRKRYFKVAPFGDERGEMLYGEAAPAQSPIPYFDVANPGQPANPGFLSPDTGQREALAAAGADLRRWRMKALRAVKSTGLAGAPFESDYIPVEVAWAAGVLLNVADTPAMVRAIFTQAEKALAAPRPWRPWSIFENKLHETINRSLAGESDRLRRLVEERGQEALNDESVWLEHQARLTEKISPILEGLARFATTSIQERAGTLPLTTNWELVNQNAAEWARQHSADLVSQVTDTTRQLIRDATAEWVESSQDLPALSARIGEIVENQSRGRLIAISESTTVFAEANDAAWQAAGYEPAAFKPTAHPGCRCYTQPARMPDGSKVQVWYTVRDDDVCVRPVETPWGRVNGCKALHMVIVSEGPWLGKRLGSK